MVLYLLNVTEDMKYAFLDFDEEYCKKYPNKFIVMHGPGNRSVVLFESDVYDRNKRVIFICKGVECVGASLLNCIYKFNSVQAFSTLYRGPVLEANLDQSIKWI